MRGFFFLSPHDHRKDAARNRLRVPFFPAARNLSPPPREGCFNLRMRCRKAHNFRTKPADFSAKAVNFSSIAEKPHPEDDFSPSVVDSFRTKRRNSSRTFHRLQEKK